MYGIISQVCKCLTVMPWAPTTGLRNCMRQSNGSFARCPRCWHLVYPISPTLARLTAHRCGAIARVRKGVFFIPIPRYTPVNGIDCNLECFTILPFIGRLGENPRDNSDPVSQCANCRAAAVT